MLASLSVKFNMHVVSSGIRKSKSCLSPGVERRLIQDQDLWGRLMILAMAVATALSSVNTLTCMAIITKVMITVLLRLYRSP